MVAESGSGLTHEEIQAAEGLLRFIDESPSAFHAVSALRARFDEAGFVFLPEAQTWSCKPGGCYYTVRNGSSIIAFKVGGAVSEGYHFQITASHSDSPLFKIKAQPDLEGPGSYKRLNVEAYGGMIDYTWFDRPLSLAGRVMVQIGNRIESRLVSLDRDVALIPSLAIHMNRSVNDGYAYKVQRDLLPLYGAAEAPDLTALVAETAGISPESVIGHDLFVYNRQAPSIWGADREFMSSPRLDDLQCAFSSLCGFLESAPEESLPVHVVFDNEEIGSSTRQGAASPFLEDTLRRITEALGLTFGEYLEKLPQSFLLSADNAHGMHPNYADKCDPVNRPRLGGGVVVKYSGNQKYATDAVSAAIVRVLAKKAGVKLQVFTNHSDIPGGTTLGNISVQHVPVKTADVGIAQLAMHSPYETCGTGDTAELIGLARKLFSSSLAENGDGDYTIV